MSASEAIFMAKTKKIQEYLRGVKKKILDMTPQCYLIITHQRPASVCPSAQPLIFFHFWNLKSKKSHWESCAGGKKTKSKRDRHQSSMMDWNSRCANWNVQ